MRTPCLQEEFGESYLSLLLSLPAASPALCLPALMVTQKVCPLLPSQAWGHGEKAAGWAGSPHI